MDTDTTDAQQQGEGDVTYLCRELRRRTAEIKKRFPFFVFVLVAIIGLGGLGIWVELVKLAHSSDPRRLDGVFTAIAAFYPALVGSASFQLLLIATGKLDRVITAFGILVLAFSFGAAVLLGIFHAQYPTVCFILAVGLVVFSIWLWIVTNADDPIYRTIPTDAPSGGDPTRDPKGDISLFKVD